MPEEEILDTLGPPLERSYYPQGRLDIWRYSLSPSDDSYRVRVVQLRDGVVVGKASEFYID
jgi:hypothetical protein